MQYSHTEPRFIELTVIVDEDTSVKCLINLRTLESIAFDPFKQQSVIVLSGNGNTEDIYVVESYDDIKNKLDVI